MTRLTPPLCFLSLLLILIISCTKEESQEELLLNGLEQAGISLADKEAVLIIPGAGCDGCISGAQYFVIDNLDSLRQFAVIFTGIGSKKALKVQLGEHTFWHKSVYIDSADWVYLPEITDVYPTIAYLGDLKIDSIVYQSPENPMALDEMKLFLQGTK